MSNSEWRMYRAQSEVCWIGNNETFGPKTFRLYSIDPDAQFEEKRKTFAYADVTRIDVDGGYENALTLVAGPIGRAVGL